MKILIGIFFIIILLLLTSKLKINVKSIKKEKNSFNIEFNVNVGLYLFGIVKIFGFSLKEDAIHFLFFRFPLSVMKINKESLKTMRNIPFFNLLKLHDFKLEELYLNLKIGSEDTLLTVFSVFVISTILSILSAKNANQINSRSYYYKITPIYNTNLLSFQISARISIKIFNLVKMFGYLKRYRKSQKLHSFSNKKIPIKI